jgi:hypothetical protein
LAASCSLFLDFANDGDLDLALIDELADQVILVRSNNTPPLLINNFLPFVQNDE